MERAQIGDLLALVNACLNATSAAALFTGFWFVKRRQLHAHRKAMITALGASSRITDWDWKPHPLEQRVLQCVTCQDEEG